MTAAPALPATDIASQFADEVLQGHREAFATLRQIMREAIQAVVGRPSDPSSPPTSASPASDSGLAPPKARALSIALKAAMAVLRTKPPVQDEEEEEIPFKAPPRPLTRDDVLLIAASQSVGKKYLPIQVVPRLKAWQDYADHMGFPAPFDFPPDLLEKFPARAERPPEQPPTPTQPPTQPPQPASS